MKFIVQVCFLISSIFVLSQTNEDKIVFKKIFDTAMTNSSSYKC